LLGTQRNSWLKVGFTCRSSMLAFGRETYQLGATPCSCWHQSAGCTRGPQAVWQCRSTRSVGVNQAMPSNQLVQGAAQSAQLIRSDQQPCMLPSTASPGQSCASEQPILKLVRISSGDKLPTCLPCAVPMYRLPTGAPSLQAQHLTFQQLPPQASPGKRHSGLPVRCTGHSPALVTSSPSAQTWTRCWVEESHAAR
jgi:hypothetical protein